MFHAPYPLEDEPKAASGLRPLKMREAFETLGYEVVDVTGYARDRRKAMKQLVRELDRGRQVDFVYSESATIPNSFTERRHFPLHVLLDRRFFKAMKSRGVPVGVFYRDAYWAFPEYVKRVGRAIAAPMRALYRWDLDGYSRYLDSLFVPSVGLLEAVRQSGNYERTLSPLSRGYQVHELPPAGEFAGAPINDLRKGDTLRLLYVGGIDQEIYNITMLMQVVMERDDVSLTICVPEASWLAFTSATGFVPNANVKVVHTRGEGLEPYYAQAHICCLYMPPTDYRGFAAPVKFFEYMAHSRPVLATSDTYVANLILGEGVGWAVDYGAAPLNQFFDNVIASPRTLQEKALAARSFGERNEWTDRAEQAAELLAPTRGSDAPE